MDFQRSFYCKYREMNHNYFCQLNVHSNDKSDLAQIGAIQKVVQTLLNHHANFQNKTVSIQFERNLG